MLLCLCLKISWIKTFESTQNSLVSVKRSLTPEGALCFSALSGAVGVSTLYWGANALTVGIGLTNVILYTSVYTPLKRISIVNTWIGSLVGALPPLMGWTAATGMLCHKCLYARTELFTGSSELVIKSSWQSALLVCNLWQALGSLACIARLFIKIKKHRHLGLSARLAPRASAKRKTCHHL